MGRLSEAHLQILKKSNKLKKVRRSARVNQVFKAIEMMMVRQDAKNLKKMMQIDHSWSHSAQAYVNLYKSLKINYDK